MYGNSVYPATSGYATKLDEEVVKLAKTGDENATEYLVNKYKNLIRKKAKSYFIPGADKEDIVQEGMVGLYKAIRDYNSEKSTSFRKFAELCITRQIITAVKTATRQKHIPLNKAVSLDKPIYTDNKERTMLDILSYDKTMGSSDGLDPQNILLGYELSDELRKTIQKNLSVFELNVLIRYLEGWSYQNMAKELNHGTKSIDNALQRIKKKIMITVNKKTGSCKIDENSCAKLPVSIYIKDRLGLPNATPRPNRIQYVRKGNSKQISYNDLEELLGQLYENETFIDRNGVIKRLEKSFPESTSEMIEELYKSVIKYSCLSLYYFGNGSINVIRIPENELDIFISRKKRQDLS